MSKLRYPLVAAALAAALVISVGRGRSEPAREVSEESEESEGGDRVKTGAPSLGAEAIGDEAPTPFVPNTGCVWRCIVDQPKCVLGTTEYPSSCCAPAPMPVCGRTPR